MTHIESKPTVYQGITYRSRLEARWAVFFDHHHKSIKSYVYEPLTKHLPNGWEYSPDFLVTLKAPISKDVTIKNFFVEIKPSTPTPAYLKACRYYMEHLEHPLVIFVHDFYKSIPEQINLMSMLNSNNVDKLYQHLFLTPIGLRSYDLASKYRFDLQ